MTKSPARPVGRLLGNLDPRRSLGARLLVLVVGPIAVVLGVASWAVSDRIAASTEADVGRLLQAEALRQAKVELRRAADLRREDLEERSFELLQTLGEVRAAVAEALEEGPDPSLPAERLDDEPGWPLVARGARGSAVLVSRRGASSAPALRDVAATRRLEPGFAGILAGHRSLSAAFAYCSTGVVRIVPGNDLSRILASGSFAPDFRVGGRWPATRPAGGPPPLVTAAYPDLYTDRGRIVSALAPVYARDGSFRAEAGVDWALGEWIGRGAFRRWKGEEEGFVARDGTVLFASAEGAGDGATRVLRPWDLLKAKPGRAGADVEVPSREGPLLVAVRPVAGVDWAYVRSVPVAAVREAAAGQLDLVLSEARARRLRAGLVALGLVPVVFFATALAARSVLAPLRSLAAWADGVSGGGEAQAPPDSGRRDEVGRLSSALVQLEGRVRRRFETLAGIQRVVREASAPTGPPEACGRVARGVARLVGAQKAWVFLWDPGRRRLSGIVPGYGLADETVASISVSPEDHSLAMLSFRTGQAFVSNDPWTDPKISIPLARKTGLVRNALFSPLATEEGPIGVLAVLDKASPFDAEDEAAVEAVASQAALLIRNARLYEELERSHARMRAAWRGRDHFLQNINHELRTPLTAILGWSEILADDRPDAATTAQAVEQIRRSAEFLHTLISDLLDLSRFDEGETKLERVDTDLARLVREAVEPGAVMAEGKGIGFSVALPAVETTVRVDPLRIRQVLWNLVHNAAKFTPRGGRIEVRAFVEDGEAVFQVTDDGVGVDAKDLPFIFERFRQADGSSTRVHRGAGIGLTLAKAFVELHGGAITVESSPGRGATFTVRIPARPSGETKAPEA